MSRRSPLCRTLQGKNAKKALGLSSLGNGDLKLAARSPRCRGRLADGCGAASWASANLAVKCYSSC